MSYERVTSAKRNEHSVVVVSFVFFFSFAEESDQRGKNAFVRRFNAETTKICSATTGARVLLDDDR